MMYTSGGLCVSEQGGPKAGNVEGSGIVPRAIPLTIWVRANEPGSPIIDLIEMSGRAEGVGRLAAMMARM